MLALTIKVLRKMGRYLDPDNTTWPAEAILLLTFPPHVDISPPDLRAAVASELALLERGAHDEARSKGWRVPGARAITRLSPDGARLCER